jgi:HCOMODA/2-hydroxy-3-carboxy-muconic semialdehyde decarboxylase
METMKRPHVRLCCTVTLLAVTLTLTAIAATPDGQPPLDTLVQANRILAMEGLVGPFGHVSVRDGADRFWIADHRSPDAVSREDLKPARVGLTADEARERNWYREIFIHSEIYSLLPDVGAVVHIHAPYSLALGTLPMADRLRPTTNPGANLGAFIPIYTQTGLIETPDAARRLAQTLQGQNGVLLRGHGAVVIGASLEQAVLRAIYLELEARYQLMARAAGTPLFYSPDETARFSKTTAIEHPWHYYTGKLERLQNAGR